MKGKKSLTILAMLVIFLLSISITGCGAAIHTVSDKDNNMSEETSASHNTEAETEALAHLVENRIGAKTSIATIMKETALQAENTIEAETETETKKETVASKETEAPKEAAAAAETKTAEKNSKKDQTAKKEAAPAPEAKETAPAAPAAPTAPTAPAAPETSAPAQNAAGLNQHQQSLLSNRILANINNLRASVGAGALGSNGSLVKIASVRSNEASYCWSHTRPNGSRGIEMIDSSKWRGENLAKVSISSGFTGSDDQIIALADRIFNNWAASSGHYANLVSANFTCIGLYTYANVSGSSWSFTTASMFSN